MPIPFETEFANEAPRDFSQDAVRAAFKRALGDIRTKLPISCPLLIDGEDAETARKIESDNPSNAKEIVAVSASASVEDAERAIQAARAGFGPWSSTPVEERSSILEKWADLMEAERDELSALMVLEAGKPWREADADTCEAIDFLRYYAREMRGLAEPVRLQNSLLGEQNDYGYAPLGVVVVIAPWNFPLAIPAGMVSAALAAGNSVVLKPAEQTPAIARRMVELAMDAGLPSGALHYLPGVGEEIGPRLVEHPEVDMIVFTGSRAVGCLIAASAAKNPAKRGLKRVVAEMGGKNAIIVDSDADLDAAVPDVLHSAFAFAGQKCSACSRVVALESVAEQFYRRLTKAASSLVVGSAEEPLTTVGPLIEKAARERLEKYQGVGEREGLQLFKANIGDLAKKGHFAAPAIYIDVEPDADLMRTELFGPLLACCKAKTLDEAIEIVNGTDYALTSGIHSRTPSNIRRARERVQAGNFYINRGVTGAIVGRQPFGGFRFSGVGSKAGGPDYLKQFLVARVWTENIVRQGFAPIQTPAQAEDAGDSSPSAAPKKAKSAKKG
jgi:RHH-type proline utilization regulon transcriptional repressor/proline dehydrogenase/delta 1-pyrroline-5-carboxylate dehydrogenase